MKLMYNSCSSFILMIEAVDLRGFIEENASCDGHVYVVSLSNLMHTVGPLLHVFEHAHFVHGY